MGLTRDQGKRVYMYEAFAVVTAAAILGTIVGIITASIMTAQLCLFAEVPFELYVSKKQS